MSRPLLPPHWVRARQQRPLAWCRLWECWQRTLYSASAKLRWAPIFGIKGGAAGGGNSQVVPLEGVSLHLTGDIHALTIAHNLVAAAIDSRIMHESSLSDNAWAKLDLPRLKIDPYSITWNRVVDVNDRSLRHIVLGLGEKADGRPRSSGYDISAASELMAILGLVSAGGNGRSPLRDLRERVGRVVIGTSGRRQKTCHHRGSRRGRCRHRADERRHHAQPVANDGRTSGLRPRRTVRQHRPRQLLNCGRPDRP